jgi:beta-galactosidase
MKLGVCYYPEHWPRDRWPIDAAMMREAGLTVVRIAEFAWTLMEPAEGQFAWAWLDEAIATLAAAGLEVVLGTPTAAPPAWLTHDYSEVLPVDAQGRTRNSGTRRHYCPTSPTYRRHSERIVRAMAERYGRHPAVVGWQIDNEFGCHDTARCYCDQCAAAFRDWLKRKYGSLEALNEAWGAVFWSQSYGRWEEIRLPNLTPTGANPSHLLDYDRFASETTVSYQQLQVDLLRQYAVGQFITTNTLGNFEDLDCHDLARPLDFIAWDSYPTGYAEFQGEALYLPGKPDATFAYDVGDPYVTGFCHAQARGFKQAPFWVMEQQCGPVNWARFNTIVRPGAVHLWTWHALAEGADAVVYFRWRAVRFAFEQHHSGLLHHDTTPAIGYQELLAMRDERATMAEISKYPVQAEVALLLDYDDLWAIQIQPHREEFSYYRHLFVFYRALTRQGIPADIVSPDADLSRYKLIVAPSAFLADAALAERLAAVAHAGGTVLFGVRSGFKTLSNLVTDQSLPGALRGLVGAAVTDWGSLPPGIGCELVADLPGLTGPASTWIEALAPEPDTAALARYADGPFAGAAALTARAVGRGRALYLGWYPTEAQAEAILGHLADEAGVLRLVDDLPAGVVAARRGPCTLLLNFTDGPQTVRMAGAAVEVGPRDVRVL